LHLKQKLICHLAFCTFRKRTVFNAVLLVGLQDGMVMQSAGCQTCDPETEGCDKAV